MADPLRRTILAKLRGKKSKKGTTVAGCSVATNGHREGKDKLLQRRDEQTQQAIIITEFSVVPDTMWDDESCFNVGFDRGLGLEKENAVVANSFTPCETYLHNNSRCGNVECSEDLSLRGRVNEELLGVSVQRETQPRWNERDKMMSFNRQEHNFAAEQRPESLGRHQEPKKLSMSIPRQYSSGDSIGFGTCGNPLNRVGCTEIGIVKLTNGQYPVSKNKDTHVSRKEDVRSPFDGSELVPQSVRNQRLKEAFIDKKDASRSVETRYINNGTQSYPIHDPNKVEENILRNIESYGSSPDFSEYKVNNLQYPTFFPTELEICDANAVNNSLPVREGVQRHNSLDSEDDDYYDNEILPFYESESQNLENSDGKNADQVKITNCDSAQETDRLRTQLKEAYYLLINAMHNISFDSQVVTNGFVDKSSISSHSQDSVCSQSSAKVIVIDAWSAGEMHPQQVSDKNTLPLHSKKTHEPFLKNFIISKSFENLHTAKVRSLLQRSVSDGNIKYPQTHLCMETLASQTCVFCSYRDELNKVVGVDGNKKRSIYDGFSSDNFQDNGDNSLLNESGGSANSLSGSSDYAEAQGNKQDFNGAQGVSAKPHGVTVNKMQEWMHKGRMLSSEMKQRIAGSSLRIHGPAHLRPGHEFSDRTKTSTQMISIQGSKSMAPCQGDQRSDLIENVHRSITARCNDFRSSHNAITVSKKRNWLQQSSGKSRALEDGLVAFGTEQEHGQVANPHNSSSEVHRLVPQSLHLYQSNAAVSRAQTAAKPRLSDPAQENEADDEGEIWYNPIPEDEEPELSHLSAVWLQGPQVAEHQASQMKPNNGDSGRVIGVSPSGVSGMEGRLSGPPSKASHTNTVHSMEPVQLHKQMFVCKVAEEIPVPRATAPDGIELSNSGFSPPSSPNPSKKGSSINWSFPDKIKSPRTVRKLSMKMKKLPELSRKLSVKGTPSSSQPEPQPPSSKASGVTEPGRGPLCTAPMPSQAAASRNVISRYHLDSSVSTYSKKKSSGSSKSCSKGGYLSDGDSPELVVKSGKHGSEGKTPKSKEPLASGSHKSHGTELDIDAFRHYSFSEQPKCAQYVSGLMNVHFYGAEDLKPPRVDSRDVYCAIQVDCVNKARTALLTCRTSFLDMDHTFNIELENAQHLKLVVFSWEPAPRRNRVCCHGTVALPMLFRVTRTHQLAVKLEPRGTIYVKLNLMEQWQNSLGRPDREREPEVFGVEAWRVVERESVGLMVPLLIEKCITEIEKRGCQVVGLYRLCGSAAVKKELREAFERDSRFVELSESQYPDINVITGVLKDYLRELPSPLITKHLYEAVLDSMAKRPLRIGANGCENEVEDSEHTVSLLENLPEVEKATLRKLLDHLKLVASFHMVNKMTCQNLAVCFGPVLLSQRQEASCHSNRVFIHSEELASALHFKKHIEVLHYLLQLWPVVDPHRTTSAPVKEPSVEVSVPPQYLRRRRDRPQVLNLSETEMAGVLRPKPGRLDSPSNRYAGDWSRCRENYLEPPKETASGEADYDDVPSEETEVTEDQNGRSDQEYPTVEEDRLSEREREVEEAGPPEDSTESFLSSQEHLAKDHTYQAFIKIQDISPVLSDRVNLKDLQESIDTLIGNLERELNKNKFNVGY